MGFFKSNRSESTYLSFDEKTIQLQVHIKQCVCCNNTAATRLEPVLCFVEILILN